MESACTACYEVAVDAPLPHTLTYAAPVEGPAEIPAGSVVRAPLGRRQVTGYVLGPAVQEVRAFTVRPLAEVLGDAPFFPPALIPFYRWISGYYHIPLGEVMRTALPLAPGLRTSRRLLLNPGSSLETILAACPQVQSCSWLPLLLEKGELGPAAVRKLWANPKEQRIALTLIKAGLLTLQSGLLRTGEQAKTEDVFQAQGPLADLLAQPQCQPAPDSDRPALPDLSSLETTVPRLRKAERRALELFCQLAGDPAEVSRAQFRQVWPAYAPACKSLVKRGLLGLRQRAVFRDPFAGLDRPKSAALPLNPAQTCALNAIRTALLERTFAPFLLFGVTGSGKTEVYLQAIALALDQGQSALLLAPEIALAAQLEAVVHARFGDQVAVLHSGMSKGERLDQWQQVLHGKAKVVLGARSAVFAPLSNLGLIIVDEEHESSYKQEEGLPYQGRDLAVLRAQQAGCPVILGSATPSLVSYHHAMSGKYRLLELPERVNPHPLPQVTLVDMKQEGPSGVRLFSGQLLAAMQDTLNQGLQTLLFLNRRGFASFMQCQDCGHVLECRHCRVSLTLHRAQNRLLCHYCGFQERPEILCPACGSQRVQGRGSGTERIEEDIAAFFPKARVARVDSDSSQNRRHLLALLSAMRDREIDILIGTQMIAKGLHFPHVALVGVLWADAGLSLPDFRAGERVFAQLEQVTGRAGRGDIPGRVFIQTSQPEHYAIQLAQRHDYAALYAEERALRAELAYPPFSRLVNLRISGRDASAVESTAEAVAAFARQEARETTVLGPAPAPLVKIRDRTRWQVLLKSQNLGALHSLCAELMAQRSRLCPAGVILQLDVDPESML